jgi:DNA-binding CsgD family transcriptional regulator
VILDRSGYALYVNSTAATLLKRANGIALNFGRFLFSDLAVQSEFETAVRSMLQTNGSRTESADRIDIPIKKSSESVPYELSVIAVRRPSDRALLPEGTGCLVLISDPTAKQSIAPQRLTRLYGLTSAEAKICEALLAVGSVNDAAEHLHITPNTVRSHLKSVYAKVGVANQAQLMQRLTLMARPGKPSDLFGVGIPGET